MVSEIFHRKGIEGYDMEGPHRRHFLKLAAGAVLPIASRRASAEAYPNRPVTIIVGFAAGGAFDITARLIGQFLSERLRQPFIIENRSGAGSNLATEAVVHSRADGYTLLLVGVPAAINATLYTRLSFNFVRDITPVAGITRVPLVMVVNPSFQARTVPELIAYAKANPGKIDMASAGNGSTPHMAGELFKKMAGVDMTHVPYRGGAPALTDLLGGQVQVYFAPLPEAVQYIIAGKLRALAVTTTSRAEVLPNVPPASDFVPGYEASGWYGLAAPNNTPAEIVEKLNKEINAGLGSPGLKARLAELGGAPLAGSSSDFGDLIAAETAKWGGVVRISGIKPD
jgi:tripartite-type tricarboxylate transporter receptor subunit TctC